MKLFASFLLLAVIGAALASRLNSESWEVWTVWGLVSLLSLIVLYPSVLHKPQEAFYAMVAASVFGWIIPDIGSAISSLLAQPKTWGLILIISLGVCLVYNPQFLYPLLVLGLVIVGFKTMLKPLVK
ncbi:MAG: hypothetical protein ABEI53_01870 [Candidatus Magasanikbacteria bacterium]